MVANKLLKRLSALLLLLPLSVLGQESEEVYGFLRLPVSAHVAAVGGDNVTLTDDDPTLGFHNPALLMGVSDRSLNLNYMTYMEGTKLASASFVRAWRERTTWGVAAQYVDYGTMRQTTVDNEQTGDFTAKDIALSASLSYQLGRRIAGVITGRFISSTIGQYSSIGVAFDLGLHYSDPERGWSVAAVARNVGGQVEAYDDEFERIPVDVQIGVSKRLVGSPLRLHATLTRLNDWRQSFSRHLVLGADLLLGDQFYVAAGYNLRRKSEMAISDGDTESAHGAGLSLGGGMQLQRFRLQLGWARYHVSASSLLINATYTL